MILLVDNYDSFTFNLARYLIRLGRQIEVIRNDRIDMDRIARGDYRAVVISPGPQAPDQAGRCLELVQTFGNRVPMLGVCLGHQVICQAFGGNIIRAPRAVHGRPCSIRHRDSILLADIPSPFTAARYHSLIAEQESLPDVLKVTAWTEHLDPSNPSASPLELIMAVEHRSSPVFGVQFHPESILTPSGYRILGNFLKAAGIPVDIKTLPGSDLAHPDELDRWSRKPTSIITEDDDSDMMPPTVLPRAASKNSGTSSEVHE